MSILRFTAFVHPEPQGSSKAFIIAGRAHITSANTKLKPFRSEVTRCAIVAAKEANIAIPMAEKHVPVRVSFDCFFNRSESIPKKRLYPSVKPDIDKICRSVLDSLTGVAFYDDGQVVEIEANKHYGSPERVEVTVTTLGGLGDLSYGKGRT
jgi:Holliday junction resolvase RusA-like endonuclease